VTTTQPQHQHRTTRQLKDATTENGWCSTYIQHQTTATLESPKDGGGLQPPKTKQTQRKSPDLQKKKTKQTKTKRTKTSNNL
jgi:hypothetical protein